MKTPNSAANLIRAIKRFCGVNQDDIRLARAMADVRLVTATNRDLPKMVHDGKFRLDLYERLNIVQLRIPPLRDHKEDIMDIAIDWRFKNDRRLFSEVSMERALLEYDYPGNVRELINILEKSKIFQEDDFEKLMAEHR